MAEEGNPHPDQMERALGKLKETSKHIPDLAEQIPDFEEFLQKYKP